MIALLPGTRVAVSGLKGAKVKSMKAPLAELDKDRKIAFWMCKQKRLGKNSPARVLWYGFLSYITDFLAERRDQGEILY